jgi:hypothetical protein
MASDDFLLTSSRRAFLVKCFSLTSERSEGEFTVDKTIASKTDDEAKTKKSFLSLCLGVLVVGFRWGFLNRIRGEFYSGLYNTDKNVA